MLVATVFDAFDNAVKQPAGMKVGAQRPIVVPRPHAVAIQPGQQTCSLAGSHDIPIDSDNTGQRASVSFHVGGTVVGFTSDGIIEVIVKTGDAGIVPEHRNDPVLLLHDRQRWFFDAGLEKAVDNRVLAGAKIPVVKLPSEGVVVAVVAPRLGDGFQFHIRGQGKAHPLPSFKHFRAKEVGPDDRNITGIEREIAGVAEFHEIII